MYWLIAFPTSLCPKQLKNGNWRQFVMKDTKQRYLALNHVKL